MIRKEQETVLQWEGKLAPIVSDSENGCGLLRRVTWLN